MKSERIRKRLDCGRPPARGSVDIQLLSWGGVSRDVPACPNLRTLTRPLRSQGP